MKVYEKWASTYNDEVGDKAQNYVGPDIVAHAALEASSDRIPTERTISILDAGCGTGLAGQALAKASEEISIDGIDLSAAMLRVASQTGVYRKLVQADLTRQLVDLPDEAYDIVTCVGTFTQGHVGPTPALREFVRVSKDNAIIAATALGDIWASGGFKAEVEKLKAEGLVTVVSEELIDYVRGHGEKAVLFILEKNN